MLEIESDDEKLTKITITKIAQSQLLSAHISLTEYGELRIFSKENSVFWTATDSKKSTIDGYKIVLNDDCKIKIENKSSSTIWDPTVLK